MTCTSLPGPRASACVPVKCWVPERERSRGWGDGAAGCRHVGVSVCAGVRQRCCWPAWGHHRSGRGGLHHGATPAPGYSVQPREEQTQHECLMHECVRMCVVTKMMMFPLTVQGLTVRALLMKWNCSMPACREGWGGGGVTISSSSCCCCSSCLFFSGLFGITHRWYPSAPQLWKGQVSQYAPWLHLCSNSMNRNLLVNNRVKWVLILNITTTPVHLPTDYL